MKNRRTRRRGIVLLLAVLLIAVVTGLLSVLALNTAALHRQRQADRVRAAVQSMTESARAYALMHQPADSASTTDASPIDLDMSALLSAHMTGSAQLTFVTIEDRSICRITARAALGNQAFESTSAFEYPPR